MCLYKFQPFHILFYFLDTHGFKEIPWITISSGPEGYLSQCSTRFFLWQLFMRFCVIEGLFGCAAGQANQMAETLCPLERLRFSAEVLTVPQQHFGGVHGGGTEQGWSPERNCLNTTDPPKGSERKNTFAKRCAS